ncbi:MAG: Gfo/Idh/MocA family oxidoreductase [Fimbriimonas sp.]|nr:Gfo/Idh/MocA family oxidoreductase [Fimbriimonas sp.]
MAEPIRIGVIGWGLRGGLAALANRPDEGVEVVALADPSERAQARFREKIGENVFLTTDYKELIRQNLDAVFVLSPDWLHEEHACTLLDAGIGVYLEKPMAITVEGCDRILSAAKSGGAKLFVGHNMRHFAVVCKMKEWIDEGRIGEVKAGWCRHFISYGGDAYFRDWHADRTRSTGLLLQKGAHDIDVLHWLCGGYSETVSAMGGLTVYGQIQDRQAPEDHVKVEFRGTWPPLSLDKLNPVVDVEDLNMVLMKLDNGVLASYQQCHYAPDAWRNYTIIGTEGRIENFGDAPGQSVVRLWNHNLQKFSEKGDEEYEVPTATGGHGGADEQIVGEFLEFLRSGTTSVTSPIAARQSVAAGVAATQSVRSGGQLVHVETLCSCLAEHFATG